MRATFSLNVLMVAIASSYLTLGVFASHHARSLWAPYAVVTFLLAATNLLLERTRP